MCFTFSNFSHRLYSPKAGYFTPLPFEIIFLIKIHWTAQDVYFLIGMVNNIGDNLKCDFRSLQMLGVAGVIAAAVIILILEVPYLIKKKLRRETWVFSFILLFAVGMGIAVSLQVNIPNPRNGLTTIYKPLYELLKKWME
ncbi:hypothetical protein [Neobacillus mesonae]|uniref:hypothetical protein n=1 Tax=Neobacillus mesonae TaxID=1193713 RepID=UPI002E1B8946|nr:hypothetical protein [Neobacillus mesonae]